MKFDFNRKNNTIAAYACLVVAFAVLLVFAFVNISHIGAFFGGIVDILSPVIYGLVIAYLINPIYRKFYKNVFFRIGAKKNKRKLRTALSLTVAYIAVLGFVTLFMVLAVPQIIKSYNSLVAQLKGYVDDASVWVSTLIGESDFAADLFKRLFERDGVGGITDAVQKLFTGSYGAFTAIMPYVLTFLGGLFAGVKNWLIGLIISVYLLAGKDILCAQLEKSVFAFAPAGKVNKLQEFAYYVDRTFGQFLVGKIVDSIIIGILTFIVMSIFKIPYTPLIAVIVGVTNIIPFFGPFIGAVPSVFFVFIDDPIKSLWTIAIIFVIQQLDGNIIGPKIIGETTGIGSLWIVVSILVFGGLFGIVGMIIAVPLFSIIYKLFKDAVEIRLEKKGMSSDTLDYVGRENSGEISKKEEK